jgi:cysteine synthase A
MGPGFVPDNLDRSVLSRVIKAWEEESFPIARRLAREEGLFVGMSSGAIAWAALERLAGIVRDRLESRTVVVVSALGGMTEALVQCVNHASKGDPQ